MDRSERYLQSTGHVPPLVIYDGKSRNTSIVEVKVYIFNSVSTYVLT